ncbi:uncharacterized protein LOC119609542 [Lucilia sericata]|uniref:uncharacterized protein LOC119609542 n=1 Tax=Lucilia sericata TaxID=13632 RepID=UPI0018A8280E|nr:uncharacterized protein LOC119609542 [Lucilia sericata]
MKLMLLLSAVILVCQADEAPKDDDPDIVIFNDGMFRMLPEVGGHHIVLVPVPPLPTVSEYKKEDADKIIITARSMMKPKNMEMTTELDPATETQRKKAFYSLYI